MHSYLRSIGFKDIGQKELEQIYQETKIAPDRVQEIVDSEGYAFAEIRKEILPGIGIAFRGNMDEAGEFIKEYYFPYYIGKYLSTREPVEVIRHSDKESFEGVCEDLRLGVDLIFHIEDMFYILRSEQRKSRKVDFGGVILSALGLQGMVILPAKKSIKEKVEIEEEKKSRWSLIKAARRGDPEAFEELTLTDMDIYSKITRRVEKEDLYSIVTSSFLPSGIETDKYQILAEIMEVILVKNPVTGQMIYIMTLLCNDMMFGLCINKEDLYGEPLPGRRFKGQIWMQGTVHKEVDS